MYKEHGFVAAEQPDAATELEALDSAFQIHAAPPVAPANHGFQLPRRLWMTMLGCYAVFFGALAVATGASGAARFAIVVSVLYTLVFFGVARIGARQAGAEERSPLDRGKALQTWTGPMDAKAVYGQVLIVPMAVAGFAVAISVIAAFVL